MAAECEMASSRGGKCGVVAVGRCLDCESAFCASHQDVWISKSGFDGLRVPIPQPRCSACATTEQRERQAAVSRAVSERAAAERSLDERFKAALLRLKERGRGLVARRFRVGVDYRWGGLVRDEWWGVYESAWPIGDQPWNFFETYNSGGGKTLVPSGVTAVGEFVPLGYAAYDELPVRSEGSKRPRPLYTTFGGPTPRILFGERDVVEAVEQAADQLGV